MLVLLALAAIAVTNCNAEAAAEAKDSSSPSRGYRLCRSMLDLCGRHGGTCGSKALHIHEEGDSCDVVREICQQVDEDTMYSSDYENAFQHDLNDYGMEKNVHLDIHREGSQWLQALCTESCHTCINPAQSNQCEPHVPFLGHGNEIKSPNWGLGLDQSCTIVNEVCQIGNPSRGCNPVVDDMYAGHACPCMSLGDLYKIEHL